MVVTSLAEVTLLSLATLSKAIFKQRSAGTGAEPATRNPQASRSSQANPWGWLPLPAAVLAGLEIGVYSTLGAFGEVGSLALTTATRSAFLIQSSTLFVPVLSALAGSPPSRAVWAGTALALAGTAVVTRDPSGAAAAGAAAGAAGGVSGDILALLASLAYALATVRLPVWSVRHRVPSLQLSLGKSGVFATAALATLGVQAAALARRGLPLETLWPGWRDPAGWALLAWAALGPGALASILLCMLQGQSLVPPSTARIILCSVPLWAAILSAVLLPGETVGVLTFVGGGLTAAAGLIAALAGRRRQQPPAVEHAKAA